MQVHGTLEKDSLFTNKCTLGSQAEEDSRRRKDIHKIGVEDYCSCQSYETANYIKAKLHYEVICSVICYKKVECLEKQMTPFGFLYKYMIKNKTIHSYTFLQIFIY